MAFVEERFPDNISRGARGGPERRTQIVEVAGGYEQRNASWSGSRRRFDAGYGVRRADDLAAVVDFFEAREGPLHGFRWKDWADHKSCRPSRSPGIEDQVIGTGDGQQTEFQLRKEYASGGKSYWRDIRKPVAGTVVVAIDGVAVSAAGWTVDTTTGVLTFDLSQIATLTLDFVADTYAADPYPVDGSAPGSEAVVTAGFEFDVPVRFDTERLDVTLDIERLGSIASIPLIELKV